MTVLLDYVLTPLARISAGKSGQVGNDRQIHTVLPGTAIRGALGAAWWRSPQHRYAGSDPQAVFDRLFAGAMTVGPAMPVNVGSTSAQARLIPLSWVKCKYPGQRCSREWHDQVASPRTECPTCGGALVTGKGWQVPPEWSLSTTRTALDKDGVAVDEQLYSRKALRDNGFEMRGTLRLRDVDGLDDAVNWLLSSMEISVGGQLSTMGRCRWRSTQRSSVDPELTAGDYALRLTSPAILIDAFGAPSVDLAGEALAIVRRAGGSARVGLTRTRPVVLSTWHGIAGLPKPEDWGVEAGSVVALHAADAKALRALLDGVGIRRLEGYGMTSLVPRQAVQRDGFREEIALTSATGVGSRQNGTVDDPPAARHTDVSRPEPLGGAAATGAATEPPAPAVPAAPASTPPASMREPEPEPEPEAAVARGPVDVMLGEILNDDTRATTAKGLLAQARNFMRMRDNGFPAAFIRGKVDETRNLPWMRDLGGSVQQSIVEILGSDELPLHIEALQRAVRERS